MAAFVLSRNGSRFNRFVYFFIILGIALPTNYFTLTKVMQITELINTRAGMILLYAAGQIPFGVFLIYGFLDTVPRELDEAAIIDGCWPAQLFWRIMVPLLRRPGSRRLDPFCDLWSEFIMPLYFLSSSDKWPMTLAVYNFFGIYESSWNLGFGGYFVDRSTGNSGLFICPALYSLRHHCRSHQGVNFGIKLHGTIKCHRSTQRPPA